MSNLPSFSNLTPAFPKEAMDHLHAIDVNLSYTHALKEIGYDPDIDATLYEDQFGNVFALLIGEMFVLYSLNKKGNPCNHIFRYYYEFSSGQNRIRPKGFLKNCFKNTGAHGQIYMLAENIQYLATDSFLGFQGDIVMVGLTSSSPLLQSFDVLILAFRDAVGGSIYLERATFDAIKRALQSKDGYYYIPGTPMMVKTHDQLYSFSDLSIETVSLREYYYIETNEVYAGFLGDVDGHYFIQCEQKGTDNYHGVFATVNELPHRKRILFTKDSTFRIPRKNATINQISIDVSMNGEFAPNIPYIPSMTIAISGFDGVDVGTMDLRDAFSDAKEIDGFFGLTYNEENPETLAEISSFKTCTGTLQITSTQKTMMDTISGLIIPTTVQGDTSIVGTLYKNPTLYLSVSDNTPAQEETAEEGGQ